MSTFNCSILVCRIPIGAPWPPRSFRWWVNNTPVDRQRSIQADAYVTHHGDYHRLEVSIFRHQNQVIMRLNSRNVAVHAFDLDAYPELAHIDLRLAIKPLKFDGSSVALSVEPAPLLLQRP